MESCIRAFNRCIPKDKIYHWESGTNNKGFIKFKLVELIPSLINDEKVIISVELLDYRYQCISKKMLHKSVFDLFRHRMMEVLRFDLLVFSINHTEILIVNQSQFLLREKQKTLKNEFKIYTGLRGYETIRDSSYSIFDKDKDDILTSYGLDLRFNRNR